MPRSNIARTITRQWEILKMIPRSPDVISTPEIGRRLVEAEMAVTPRTVQRDIEELSLVFPIDCHDESKPKVWFWNEAVSLDLPGMSLTEALSLGLIEEILRELVPPSFMNAMKDRFTMARGKLAGDTGSAPRKWQEIFRYLPAGLPFQPPLVDGKSMEAIQEALVRGKWLSLTYRSFSSGNVTERILNPLAIVLHGQRPYLIAMGGNSEPARTYAIQRCANAVLLHDRKRVRPAGFSLDEYLAKGGILASPDQPIRLRAILEQELADRIEETPLSADQKITLRDGRYVLTATVPDSWQLHFWILSQGAAITVEKPMHLRKLIIAKLQDTLKNYPL